MGDGGSARREGKAGLISRCLGVVMLVALPALIDGCVRFGSEGCGLNLGGLPVPECHPTPTDCAASANAPWRVGRDGTELELIVGDSHRQSVTPGFPVECRNLTSVAWSIEDPSVASVTQLGPRNAQNDTAEDVSRAWVTGLAPGLTTVRARIMFTDGVREAQPKAVRVVVAETPPPESFLVAQGRVTVTFNPFTGAGGSLVPLTLPGAGRVDISVDWI